MPLLFLRVFVPFTNRTLRVHEHSLAIHKATALLTLISRWFEIITLSTNIHSFFGYFSSLCPKIIKF